ncbi:hypothetical protein PUV54_00035 [Hyphococcus flavus]|uniref:Uncharacterized protein n=1 Tax=Hyphococcus flavus TaxID=1866326 RepID=A0AAE9ZEF5_9PROT|nr:hypothetical protein [Hyphococcus flavus]WDI31582.1 hypothetical protein PUV54_00035 [Hyphococcus flavus]
MTIPSIGGASAMIGGSLLAMTAAAPASQDQLVVSFYDFKTDPYVDLVASHGTPYGEVKVSGSNWRSQDLFEGGYIDQDGTMTSAPAGLTQITGYEILYQGFSNNPSYYNGRTLVLECDQGKFKDGSNNTIGISQLGATLSDTTWHEESEETATNGQTQFTLTNGAHSGADWNDNQVHVFVDGLREAHRQTPTTDYTVAKSGDDVVVTFQSAMSGGEVVFIKVHRREIEIDTENWGTSAPRSAGPFPVTNIGNASVIEDWKPLRVFWKDEEDDFRDRFNNPYKFFAPWFRNYYTFQTHLRVMDLFDPMRNCASVPADMALLTDATIGGGCGQMRPDHDYTANGGVGHRQGNPILPLLDFCKQTSCTPWINMPVYVGSPFYPVVEYTSIQSGGSTQLGYLWFNPNEVDLGETVTIDSQSVAGVATLDVANKRIVLDADGNFAHSSNSPNVIYKVTVSYTDVDGDPQTFTCSLRVITDGAGNYYWWRGADDWEDNETFYDDHRAWDLWADWILDQLVAVDWSPSDEVIIEFGNELWNGAAAFDVATQYAASCGVQKAFHEANYSGAGYISAKLKKRLDDRMTARALSFNITMALGVQTSVGAYFVESRMEGYSGFWEGTEGGSLTGSALNAKLAEAKICITNYWSDALSNDAASNLTGETGATHVTEVTDAYDADEAAFWQSVEDWYLDDTASGGDLNSIKYKIRWVTELYDACQAEAENWNTKVQWSYEGGSHDFSGSIPSGIRSHSGFNASYYNQMQGPGDLAATIWATFVSRIRAKDPTFAPAAYGGPYDSEQDAGDYGQPWAYGEYQATLNAYATAIQASGV